MSDACEVGKPDKAEDKLWKTKNQIRSLIDLVEEQSTADKLHDLLRKEIGHLLLDDDKSSEDEGDGDVIDKAMKELASGK